MAQRVEIRAPDHEAECTAVLSYWYKSLGDTVTEGDELLDYETDKATITLEAPCPGTLAEVLVQEDETITPNMLLGYLEPA
jgi:pyruvate/2-oxoglutarate dehydrogenase complex dihydrolipoamide acyltransferase (E2) component